MWKKLARRAGRGALAAVPALAFAAAAAAQDGDVEAGAKVFKKCAVCHSIEEGAPSKAGPNLYGVIGRTTGTLEGFKFSPALVEAGEAGHVWTVEELSKYLENPKAMLPGNRMTFPGLKKPEDRADVIAYIASVSGG